MGSPMVHRISRARSRTGGVLALMIFALPLLLLYLFVENLPDPQRLSARLLAPEGNAWDMDALGSLPGAGSPERLAWEGFADAVFLTVGRDVLRLALPREGISSRDAAYLMHEDLERSLEEGGRKPGLRDEVSDDRRAVLTTRFADGRTALTVGLRGAALQALLDPESDPDGYFVSLGIVEAAPGTGLFKWVASHRMTTYFGALVLYGFIAAAVHMAVAGRRLRVRPPRGIQPVPPSELMARILAINGLGIPIEAVRVDESRALLRFRQKDAGVEGDAKWVRSSLVVLDLALHPGRKVVTAIETESEASSEKSKTSAGRTGSISRGFSIEPYSPDASRGLSFRDGRWVTEPHDYTFHILELRDPIIGAVTASGWTWQPKVFSH